MRRKRSSAASPLSYSQLSVWLTHAMAPESHTYNIGFAVRVLTDQVLEYSPWVTIVIGAGLAVLGVRLASGHELNLRIPRLDRGGRSGHPA